MRHEGVGPSMATVRAGGIVRPDVVKQKGQARAAAETITVSWKWYDEANGTVEWTFHNPSSATATCVLLRNNYYFGGAFWPVYLANPEFGMQWAQALTPLVDNGVVGNTPPMGVLEFDDGSRQVVFLFTLAAGQTWSMLEGGFSAVSPPVVQSTPTVTGGEQATTLCIGYDPTQVTEWDVQTGTTLQGYSPNPSTIATVIVSSPGTPDIRLFPGDSAVDGACSGTPPNPCQQILESAIQQLESGQILSGIEGIFEAIFCYIDSGAVTLKDVTKAFLKRVVHR